MAENCRKIYHRKWWSFVTPPLPVAVSAPEYNGDLFGKL
jgi:hypothetical protein